MIGGYRLSLNGKELPLIDPLVPIHLGATASDASWKVWNGEIRTKIPVQLKAGDKLKLSTLIDWSQANQLSLDMLTRIEETRRRDTENKSAPSVYGVTLDREK